MKRKKGVILLITILFIVAITSIYLKNLDDTKKLIDESQNTYNLNYTMKIIDDLNAIISKLNEKFELYSESGIDDFFERLPSTEIPIEFKNILVHMSFEKIEEKCDINDIYNDTNETKKTTCIEVLNNFNIDIDEFKNNTLAILSDSNTTISNNKQKDNIIDSYLGENEIEEENNLKDQITFVSDSNNTKYLKGMYKIYINETR